MEQNVNILNYEQISTVINSIKEDLSTHKSDPKTTKFLCEEIYTYLNQTGGYYPVPKNLESYKNILSTFRNPTTFLSSIRKIFPSNVFFDEENVKKEIQIMMLLWLYEATKKPIRDIDLYSIVDQYNTTIH